MQSDSISSPNPWTHQLDDPPVEPWQAGRGILILCALTLAWFVSLALRFTSGEALMATLLWVAAMTLWLLLQIRLARAHSPEGTAHLFSTIVQALTPTAATLAAVGLSDALFAAAKDMAQNAQMAELAAIHILRLAAWGTIRKYLDRQLPRYFYLFGSLPDFGFAISAVILTAALSFGLQPGSAALIWWNIAGIAAFLGAAFTMYLGLPRGPLAWRWPHVVQGAEPPTLLPFRWPMNLAPAFCGPIFWMAHGLFLLKLLA